MWRFLHITKLGFACEMQPQPLLDQCVRMLARYSGQNEDIPPAYTRGLFYRGVE